jgi:hypothetical protein
VGQVTDALGAPPQLLAQRPLPGLEAVQLDGQVLLVGEVAGALPLGRVVEPGHDLGEHRRRAGVQADGQARTAVDPGGAGEPPARAPGHPRRERAGVGPQFR